MGHHARNDKRRWRSGEVLPLTSARTTGRGRIFSIWMLARAVVHVQMATTAARSMRLLQMPNIVILGTGMAGFGAAYRLHSEGFTPTMYDKNGYHGGHTTSFRYESNFVFDLGPHISFTQDPRIQDLLADSVDQQYETVQISLNNYWRGYWPRHPV